MRAYFTRNLLFMLLPGCQLVSGFVQHNAGKVISLNLPRQVSSPFSINRSGPARGDKIHYCQQNRQSQYFQHDSRRPSSLHAWAGAARSIRSLHSNNSYVLSAILWLSTFGVSLERRTTIGKALSAPLATMAIALTAANLGLLPFESPICKSYYFILLAPPDRKSLSFSPLCFLLAHRFHGEPLSSTAGCSPSSL